MTIARFFKDPTYRHWAMLWLRYRRFPRYQAGRLRAFGYDLEVADHISVVHQLRDIYVEHEYHIPDPGPRPVIVDVGANVGVSVLYHCRMLDDPEIHAFEADPNIFAMLERNVRMHAPTARVHLHRAAAHTSTGSVKFAREGADGGQVQDAASSTGDMVEIPSVDLLDYLQGLPRIDLLKIDIEGAESFVVPHCAPVFDRVQRIFIEVHSSPGREQALPQLLTLLQRSGFRLHVQSAEIVRSPFVPSRRHFDNQVNVFAYRVPA
jgi:FkbM family methyltransferase